MKESKLKGEIYIMTKFTTQAQNQVLEFHEKFGHPVSNKPTSMNLERALNRSVWTGEEIIEFLHASNTNEGSFDVAFWSFIEGLKKAYEKSKLEEFPKTESERVTAQADALTDALYFVLGSFVEIGVDAQSILDIVQESNMSKLFTDENGNKFAKYREDGKILKSPSFFAPEFYIAEEIKNQSK